MPDPFGTSRSDVLEALNSSTSTECSVLLARESLLEGSYVELFIWMGQYARPDWTVQAFILNPKP